MGKRKSPDAAEKEYWRIRRRFADLWNAYLFHGEQVLKEEDIAAEDSGTALLLGEGEKGRKVERHRDVLKQVRYVKKYGVHFALLGIENQEKVHYGMPLRVMEYDAYSYVRQWKEKSGETEKIGEAFWSDVMKKEKLIPVITLVLYYGEKPWDGAKSLRELLELPPELEGYVNDYPLHLIEAGRDKLPLQDKDNRELFEILGLLYAEEGDLKQKKEKVLGYIEENQVSDSVVRTAAAATGRAVKRVKKGENIMCKFFDELQKEGERIGKAEGERIGEARGKAEGERIGEARGKAEGERTGRMQGAVITVKNMMSELGVTLEKACQLAEITPESYREYAGTVK